MTEKLLTGTLSLNTTKCTIQEANNKGADQTKAWMHRLICAFVVLSGFLMMWLILWHFFDVNFYAGLPLPCLNVFWIKIMMAYFHLDAVKTLERRQCRPWSDCSLRSHLMWVYTAQNCLSENHCTKSLNYMLKPQDNKLLAVPSLRLNDSLSLVSCQISTCTVQVKKNPHFLFFSMINCLFFWEKLGEIVENFSRFLQEIQYFLQEIPVFLPEILGLYL